MAPTDLEGQNLKGINGMIKNQQRYKYRYRNKYKKARQVFSLTCL